MNLQKTETQENITPKTLVEFNECNIGEYLNSKRMFLLLRTTVRNIYKSHYKDKSVSKAFLDIEKILNHIEYHYRLV